MQFWRVLIKENLIVSLEIIIVREILALTEQSLVNAKKDEILVRVDCCLTSRCTGRR